MGEMAVRERGKGLKEVQKAIRPQGNLDPSGGEMEGKLGRKSLRLHCSSKKVSAWLMESP